VSVALVGLVLLAAIFHASWNAMLKAAENPLALAARAVTFGAAASLPPVAAVWLWQGRPALAPIGWLILAASAGLELLYFITLSAAYQRGELSVVYPIARGTAPLLAVAVGLLILGERLRLPALAGIACLLLGIWAVRRPAADSAALAPAIATGVLIAAYSSLDRIGVRLGPPWLYGWLLWLFIAVLLQLFSRITRLPRSRLTHDPGMSLTVGVLMMAAYFPILFALSVAPLAVIAPLRESAIVLVTAWGIWRLRERRGAWLRVAGAVVIVGGILLLTIA
jgi:drug/metabolite transporter (DMT)-like permease